MKTAWIYKIACLENGRVYIGQTICYHGRRHQHLSELHFRKHHNRALQQDFDRLGESCFVFSTIREVPESRALDEEQAEIQCALRSGEPLYNYCMDTGMPRISVPAASRQITDPWSHNGDILLSPREVALLLKVTKCSLSRWRAHDQGPRWIKTDPGHHGRIRYPKLEVARYLRIQCQNGDQP